MAVIAAGERWRGDGSIRPALEGHLGAGAVLSELAGLGYRDAMSPEASAAADLMDTVKARLFQSLGDCVGARELEEMGSVPTSMWQLLWTYREWSRCSLTGSSEHAGKPR